jgi:hypothetical protein
MIELLKTIWKGLVKYWVHFNKESLVKIAGFSEELGYKYHVGRMLKILLEKGDLGTARKQIVEAYLYDNPASIRNLKDTYAGLIKGAAHTPSVAPAELKYDAEALNSMLKFGTEEERIASYKKIDDAVNEYFESIKNGISEYKLGRIASMVGAGAAGTAGGMVVGYKDAEAVCKTLKDMKEKGVKLTPEQEKFIEDCESIKAENFIINILIAMIAFLISIRLVKMFMKR